MHTIWVVDYGWDKIKAQANLRKHGIDFADAVVVLEDEEALTLEDDDPDEDRFITIGIDALGQTDNACGKLGFLIHTALLFKWVSTLSISVAIEWPR